MGNINLGRVILGGLVAGLVLNIGEFLLNAVILGQEMSEMFKRLNLPEPGGSFIVVAIGLTFLLGIVIVLTYAMMRPRFGPGPKTAIFAALIQWFGVYFYSAIFSSLLFGVGTKLLLIGMVWGLVEYILGAIAGGWLYKES